MCLEKYTKHIVSLNNGYHNSIRTVFYENTIFGDATGMSYLSSDRHMTYGFYPDVTIELEKENKALFFSRNYKMASAGVSVTMLELDSYNIKYKILADEDQYTNVAVGLDIYSGGRHRATSGRIEPYSFKGVAYDSISYDLNLFFGKYSKYKFDMNLFLNITDPYVYLNAKIKKPNINTIVLSSKGKRLNPIECTNTNDTILCKYSKVKFYDMNFKDEVSIAFPEVNANYSFAKNNFLLAAIILLQNNVKYDEMHKK